MLRRNFLRGIIVTAAGLIGVAIPIATATAEEPSDKKTRKPPDKRMRAMEAVDWDGKTFGWLPIFETKEAAEAAVSI